MNKNIKAAAKRTAKPSPNKPRAPEAHIPVLLQLDSLTWGVLAAGAAAHKTGIGEVAAKLLDAAAPEWYNSQFSFDRL